MIKKLYANLITHAHLVFFVILAVGAYSRFITVIDKSFPYTYDIGRDLLAISEIVHNFSIPLIGPTTGLPGLFYGPWWYYSLVPAFFIGGGNPQAVDAFMVLTGLAVIYLGYYIGQRVQGSFLGLSYSALLAFSSSLIAASTQIWNPNVAPLYLILIYGVLIAYTHAKNKNLQLVLAFSLGILAGLNIDSEVVYGLVLTVGLTLFLSIFQFRRAWREYIFYALGLLVIFSPRIAFELRHDFVMTRTIIMNNFHGGSGGVLSLVPQGIVKTIMALELLWELTIGIHITWLAVCIAGCVLLGLLCKYKSYASSVKYLLNFSVITLITYIGLLSMFKGDIWGHYIVGVPIIMLFLVAVSAIPTKNFKRLSIVMVVLLCTILIAQIDIPSLYSYYSKPRPIGNASFYKNQIEVIDYVYQEAHGRSFNQVVYTPPVHDYTYQYLFSWYGQKKYHKLPSSIHEKLYFVIFEPDPGYEGRLRDWLLAREKDGTVVKEKVFPSGITVQTRLH